MLKNKDTKRSKSRRMTAKKRYALGAVLAVFILAVYFFSARATNLWPFQNAATHNSDTSSNPKPHTPSPKNTAATNKGDTQPSVDPNKTADQIPTSPTMAATITTLSETNQDIHFTATISNSPTAGTCVVTFSNPNDRPVTKQVDATVSNGTASCGPLTIPANEFSYLGTWQVTLHYYLGSQQATAQDSVTIQ